MDNNTSEFLLWEFSNIWELQIMHVALLLILYLMTVTWNLLIISAVVCDHHLHIPMYFFLTNLAMQDIGSVSAIIPKTLFNFLTNIRTISHSGCVAQVMFLLFFLSCDISLLTVMAYDRYIAICNPLHYEMIMNRKTCTKMIASVWTASLLNASLQTLFTFMTPFCSNNINQFFCEVPYLLKIACSDLYVFETGFQIFTAMLSTGCFAFVIVTYVYVFSAVLRIPSDQGRKKAFSTCLPHLVVFFLFLFTSCLAYLKPTADSESHPNFLITIMYSIIPALLNPLIYSMRNKDIKVALLRLFDQNFFLRRISCASSYFQMRESRRAKIR